MTPTSRAGARRQTRACRKARWLAGGAVFAAGAVLLSPGTAAANECPLTGIVECPGAVAQPEPGPVSAPNVPTLTVPAPPPVAMEPAATFAGAGAGASPEQAQVAPPGAELTVAIPEVHDMPEVHDPASTVRAASASGGEVLSASAPGGAPGPALADLDELAGPSGSAVSILAGETVLAPQWPLAALAASLVLVVTAAGLGRAVTFRAHHVTDPAGSAPEADLTAGAERPVETRGSPVAELHHHLAAIDTWVRTLDDRWGVLAEADKRLAMQVIRRNSEAALHELPLLAGVS